MLGVTILFSGCSINVPNYVNTNISSIFITVSYDEPNLTQIGMNSNTDKEEFREELEKASQKYLNKLNLKYRSTLDDLASRGGIDANERILYKNHLQLYSGWDENTYIMELRFHSLTASRIFVKYCGEMEVETLNELFAIRVSEKITGLMGSLSDFTGSVTDYYNSSLENSLENFGGDLLIEDFEGIEVEYMFVSSNKRLHSNGVVLAGVEGHVHHFKDLDGDSFIFYRIEAQRHIWYLLSFTVTMVFIAISLVIIYFKKNKKSTFSS